MRFVARFRAFLREVRAKLVVAVHYGSLIVIFSSHRHGKIALAQIRTADSNWIPKRSAPIFEVHSRIAAAAAKRAITLVVAAIKSTTTIVLLLGNKKSIAENAGEF